MIRGVHEAIADKPFLHGHPRHCFIKLQALRSHWLQYLAKVAEKEIGVSKKAVEVRVDHSDAGVKAVEAFLPQYLQNLILHHVFVDPLCIRKRLHSS